MKFLAVRQFSLMTHYECCCWLSISLSRDWCVWEPSPTPPDIGTGGLFKLAFWRLFLSTLKHCHMDLWLARLVLIHHNLHGLQHLPSANITQSKSEYLFRIRGVFSLVGCLLPFLWLDSELLSSSHFWADVSWIAHLLGPLASCLASSTAVSLEW